MIVVIGAPGQGKTTLIKALNAINNEHEYKRNGQLKTSGVRLQSRKYADTYEEAVEGYNRLVTAQVNALEELIAKYRKCYI